MTFHWTFDEKHSHYHLLHFRIVHTHAFNHQWDRTAFHCQWSEAVRIKLRIIVAFNLFWWFDRYCIYTYSFEHFPENHFYWNKLIYLLPIQQIARFCFISSVDCYCNCSAKTNGILEKWKKKLKLKMFHKTKLLLTFVYSRKCIHLV